LIIFHSSLYGFDLIDLDYTKTLTHWRALEQTVEGADPWVKVCKYKLAAFYSCAQGCAVPPNPFPGDRPDFLLGGKWARWFRIFSDRACIDCRQGFLTGLLFGVKKGCPRASSDGLVQARIKTFNQITTFPKEPSPQILPALDLEINNDFVRRELERTVDEIFGETRLSFADLFKLPIPSTSANYYSSRSNGGAVSSIFENLSERWFIPPPTISTEQSRSWNEDFDVWEDDEVGRIENQEQFRIHEIEEYEQLFKKALDEEPLVETVALPEALKVRVITKGPPLMGYVLKPFQSFIHGVLRRHSTFTLVGRPVSEDIVKEKIGLLRPGEKFLSGDYSAATDGMFSWISEVIAHRIVDCVFRDWKTTFPDSFRELYLRSLTMHRICHPVSGEPTFQKNGQLMGSISSFPILCIANATICRIVMERSEKRSLSLRRCRLLVNGDDCLFPCNEIGHALWLTICPYFGMEPSIGKYYWHNGFCNVNSTTYIYDPEHQDWALIPDSIILCKRSKPFRLVKFVNYGILLNLKRSGGPMGPESVFDEYFTFSSNSDELVDTFPDRLVAICYEQYIRDFGRFASSNHLKLPWFVPREYGGVGLRAYGRHRPTALDLGASYLIDADDVGFPTIKKETVWKFHEGVSLTLPKTISRFGDSQYDDWYGYATKVFFQTAVVDNNFDIIYSDHGRSPVKALRRSERTWSKYVQQIKSGRVTNYVFEFQAKSRLKPCVLGPIDGPCLF
jgi:hypothetical protein